MSYTAHGIDLRARAIEQPGAKFRKNKKGFDTGTRTFRCDRAMVDVLVPRIGDADTVFTSMFVEDVDITFDKMQIATAVVSYAGAIDVFSKPDYVEYSTTDQVDSLTADDGNVFSLSLPTISHYYVTKTFPSVEVGSYVTPPRYSERLPKELNPRQLRPINSGTGDIWDTHFFTGTGAGWRLRGRQFSESGTCLSIVDVYTYSITITGVGYRDGSSSSISGT